MTAPAPTGYGRLEIVSSDGWFMPTRGRRSAGSATRSFERRYRALERARVRRHARPALLLVPAAALANVLAMSFVGARALTLTLALQGTLAVMALAGHILLRGPLRARPWLVVGAVAAGSSLASAASGLAEPTLTGLAAGWLLVIPLGVALLIPWRPLAHVAWLAVNSTVALPALMLMPGLPATDRLALCVTYSAALGISLAGNLLHEREDRRNFALRVALIRGRTELAAANRALQDSLRHDPLTGVRNRIRLAEDMVAARSAVSRGETWALLIIDIDHFKQVNDRYGHAAGDRVLREVVGAVRASVRPIDGVYRIGGEEFVALLPRVSEAEAIAVADRLRHAVRRLEIANPGNRPHGMVTVSVGLAMMRSDSAAADTDTWLARADGALYSAKAAGRNRTEIATAARFQFASPPVQWGDTVTASAATWPPEGGGNAS